MDAQRTDVAGLFACESLVLVMIGLAIGVPVALISAYALRSLLSASIAALAAAAVLATSMPLVCAARTDPMAALPHD